MGLIDFFRQKWNNKNLNDLKQKIEKISDQDILKEIFSDYVKKVFMNPDSKTISSEIFKLVVSKIKDQKLLIDRSKYLDMPWALYIIESPNINDQYLLRQLAYDNRKGENFSSAVINKINDQYLLCDIAKKGVFTCANKALSLITDQYCLMDIFQECRELNISLKAINLIQNAGFIESIIKGDLVPFSIQNNGFSIKKIFQIHNCSIKAYNNLNLSGLKIPEPTIVKSSEAETKTKIYRPKDENQNVGAYLGNEAETITKLYNRSSSDIVTRYRKKNNKSFEKHFCCVDTLQGGMGLVYLGYSYRTDKYQAVKTFKDDVFRNRDGSVNKARAERFMREAITWLSLGAHPNIVGADFAHEIKGKPHLFLEYIVGHEEHGTTLKSWLDDTSKNIELMLNFAIQFCEGMSYAVKNLIISHRDIKPSNIMIAYGGIVKITDFGLVKVFDIQNTDKNLAGNKKQEPSEIKKNITQEGEFFGTFHYMAPEQWIEAGKADECSDIYSFGAVMYEMLSGHPPFPIPSEILIAHPSQQIEYLHKAHHKKKPVPINHLNQKVDSKLAAIIDRCLKKKTFDRFESFKELQSVLVEYFETIKNIKYMIPEQIESFNSLYLQGKERLDKDQHQDAKLYFEDILKLDPNYFHAIQSIGHCHIGMNEFDNARKYFMKCLIICPSYTGAIGDIGFTYHLEGDEDTAMKRYREALEIDQNNYLIWNSLGMSYLAQNESEKAIEALDKALAINPLYAEALENKAIVFEQRGDFQKAAEFQKNALSVRPGKLSLIVDFLNNLLKIGAYTAAYKVAEEMEKNYPYNPNSETVFSFVNNMLAVGKKDIFFDISSIDFQDQITNLPDTRFTDVLVENADYDVLKIVSWIQLKEYEKAVELGKKILKQRNDNIEVYANMSAAYCKMKLYDLSTQYAQKAIEINRKETLAWNVLAIVNLESGSLYKAITYIDEAIKIEVKNGNKIFLSDGYNNKGNIYMKMNMYSKALQCYEEALSYNYENYIVMENMAICYNDIGKTDDALHFIKKAMGINIRSSTAWRIYGDIYYAKGEFNEAVKLYKMAIEINDSRSDYWKNLGKALHKMNRIEEARDCFEKAQILDA